jgi:hypothetical protein
MVILFEKTDLCGKHLSPDPDLELENNIAEDIP